MAHLLDAGQNAAQLLSDDRAVGVGEGHGIDDQDAIFGPMLADEAVHPAASAIAAGTAGAMREPPSRVKVPAALITGRTPSSS